MKHGIVSQRGNGVAAHFVRDAVRERVEDGELLWSAGRKKGAFLMALVAVAARARLDYPPPLRDRDAFERFVESRLGTRIAVEFRGELYSLERVFYKWMRCELVHDGALPIDLSFFDVAKPGELSVRAGGAPEYTLLVSAGWLGQLTSWASS